MAGTAPTIDDLRELVGSIADPELPPLTLVDLGILRSVECQPDVDGGETVVVTVTPTYSGCPAVEYIEAEIARCLAAAGCRRFRVERCLSPAWTTDFLTADGHRKLTEMGIAPPGAAPDNTAPPGAAPGDRIRSTPVAIGRGASAAIACPRCGSERTEVISPFGSTACKALYRCRACAEPFDHFKAI